MSSTVRDATTPQPSTAILRVRDLHTAFPSDQGNMQVVDGVSLALHPGETLAVVGESGSGKTMTFLSVLGLVPPPGQVISGEVIFDGVDITKVPRNTMRKMRAAGIAMVFQDPLTALNPVFTIGSQLIEVIRAHTSLSKRDARKRAIEVLDRVQIPDPQRRIGNYPHELSGGMRQRVLIAMAIVLGPKVLIADEPTTALDVTVQAQILELLAELRQELSMAMVLITHDLGLVAKYADRVAVMYAGQIVETSSVAVGFAHSLHPYTRALFDSIPRLDGAADAALSAIDGQPPDLAKLPPGCAFEPRCFLGRGQTDCCSERPTLSKTTDDAHLSACLHWRSLLAQETPNE